jgi:acyl carrier protein
MLKVSFFELLNYEFDINNSLDKQGLDGLDKVELCMFIEKKYQIEINDDQWEKFSEMENYFFLIERLRCDKLNILGI